MKLTDAISKYYQDIILNEKYNEIIFNVDLQKGYILDMCSDSNSSKLIASKYIELLDRVNILEVILTHTISINLLAEDRTLYEDIMNQDTFLKIIRFIDLLDKPYKKINRQPIAISSKSSKNIKFKYRLQYNYINKDKFKSLFNNDDIYIMKLGSKTMLNDDTNKLVMNCKDYAEKHQAIFKGFKVENNNLYAIYRQYYDI